ncbi:MAG: hypothetical protein K2J63_13495 [Muribaculaceae bacterium]|nr:hypothetical protein [Muribaculaceae bacterium]
MFKTKTSCIISLVIVLALTINLMIQRAPWWIFPTFFFGYMSVFSNLMVLLIGQRNPYAKQKLIKCAYAFGILAIVTLIVMIILFSTVLKPE